MDDQVDRTRQPDTASRGQRRRLVEPSDMLAELREDNQDLTSRLREAHNVCEERRDVATASLIEVWIDESERRIWFLFEAGGRADSSGH